MGLVVKIGADLRNFDREMNRLTRDVRTVGNKFVGVGAAMTAGLTVPLVGLGVAAVKVGSDFEASMSKVGAVTGATGKDMDKLTATARELGATTQFSASEAAAGMQFLGQAGFKTNEIIDAMPGLLSLAAAGALDLGAAADIASNIMSGFGIEASKSGHVADVLAKAAADANTDVTQLGEAMVYLAPVSKTMGWSLEESTAAVMALSDAGIQGAQAGAAFSTSLGRLAKPTDEMQKTMDKLGISFFDAEGNMKSMPGVVAEIEKGTAGMSAQQKSATLTTLFGAEAYKHWAVLLDKGSGALETNTKSLVEADGAAKKMADTMNDNLQGRMKEMMSALEEMAISIYEVLKPAIEAVVGFLTKLAQRFGELSPTTKIVIVAIAGVVAALGPLLMIIGTCIIMFGTASAALTTLGVSFLSVLWPIAAVIAAIAAVIAIFAYWDEIKEFFINLWQSIGDFLVNTWDNIKSYATESWNAIKEMTINVWESIKEFFVTLWESIKDIVSTAIAAVVNFFAPAWEAVKAVTMAIFNFIKAYIEGVWTAIMYFVGPVLESIKSLITSAWESIKSFTSSVWEAIKSFVTSIWEGIKSIAETVWNGLSAFFTAWLNMVSSVFTTIWNSIKSIVTSIWEGISSTASTVWNGMVNIIMTPVNSVKSSVVGAFDGMKNGVIGAWESMKNGIKSVINSIIGMINKFIDGFNTPAELLNNIPGVDMPLIPHIPMLATGGTVLGSGSAIVGEAGPELLKKSGSGVTVTPLSAGEKARGFSGGYEANITINTNSSSPGLMARQLRKASRQMALEWGIV